jgi:hypothetical protein
MPLKLTIKLSHKELLAITGYLEQIVQNDHPVHRTDKIIHVLMVKFWKKLKAKCIILEPRSYRIGIEPETAMAFVEWFDGVPIQHTTYEGNIIRKLINQFDQQTSKAA